MTGRAPLPYERSLPGKLQARAMPRAGKSATRPCSGRSAGLDAGVPLGDVQAGRLARRSAHHHAPERAHGSSDRYVTDIVAAYFAGAAR